MTKVLVDKKVLVRALNVLACMEYNEMGSVLYGPSKDNTEEMVKQIKNLLDTPELEPFGYFKSEPFGWTDCAETDEGAIPLYQLSVE